MAKKRPIQDEALFAFDNEIFQLNQELIEDEQDRTLDPELGHGSVVQEPEQRGASDGGLGIESTLLADSGTVPVDLESPGELRDELRRDPDASGRDATSLSDDERSVPGVDDEQSDVQGSNVRSELSNEVHEPVVHAGDQSGEDRDAASNGADHQRGTGVSESTGDSGNHRRDPGSSNPVDQEPELELSERQGPVPPRFVEPLGSDAPKSERQRVQANLAALRLLNTLETENRWPSVDEQRVLAKYVSWGGASKVFESWRNDWEVERQELRSLVDEDTYNALSASTLNAHFTPELIAEAMWTSLVSAGFETGQVLEPGSGKGTFIKHAPSGAQMVGVELDTVTAKIAGYLNPDAEIHRESFGTYLRDNGSFHAVIGNVPFGDFKVPDIKHNPGRHSIHNHFIIKSLQLTAPGGYVAVVTSSYTLDSKRRTARAEMNRHGDLVGAVRLPNGAFRQTAGTDVLTDVLIFRARDAKAKTDSDAPSPVDSWQNLVEIDADGEKVSVNEYFAQHPEYVLGEWTTKSTPHGGRTVAVKNANFDGLGHALEEAMGSIIESANNKGLEYSPVLQNSVEYAPGMHEAVVFTHTAGHVRLNGSAFEQYEPDGTWSKVRVIKKDIPEATELLKLRDGAVALLDMQRSNADSEEITNFRNEVRKQYEAYVQTYGALNRYEVAYRTPTARDIEKSLARYEAEWRTTLPDDGDVAPEDEQVPEDLLEQWTDEASAVQLVGNRQNHLKFLNGDPSLSLLTAIEHFDADTDLAQPGDLLLKDVVDLRSRPSSADTAESAIAISMDELGHIDIDRISELLSLDTDAAREAVEPLSFTDPETNELIPSVIYLSGLVRDKLELARHAAIERPEFMRNVAALENVLPAVVTIGDISLNPGVRYVTDAMYSQFARETLKVDAQVEWNQVSESWEVKMPKKRPSWDPKVLADFGTDDKRPDGVLAAALNGRAPVVTWVDDEGKRHKDEQATTAVREKVDKIKEVFRVWAVSDPERAQQIEDQYNRDFNSLVAPDYSALAAKMSFSGLAAGRKPYDYQQAAVARIVNEPSVLLDHVVGAGKTGTMIMSCMELRRTGIANKPAIVVPNHLVEQVGREFNEWYPGAKVLTVGSGLNHKERMRVVAQAAACEWDAVVMPMTTFEKIKIDPLRTAAWQEEEIEKLRAELPGADDRYQKQLEKQIKQLEARYDKLTQGKDPGMIWEQTGIDYLFVDEAHNYKNLGRSAPIQELSCSSTARAEDLDYKLRAMREAKVEAAISTGRYSSSFVPAVASFATGTPVANNMSEMWVMQHYLRPDLLERAQVEKIGAWANNFTVQGQVIRPKPAGGGYDQVMKVKEYINVPELVGLSAQFTDVVTADNLTAKIPTLRSHERLLLRREPSPLVEQYVEGLQDRAELLKGRRPEKGGDNMLSVVNDGRNVALDSRLVGYPAEPDGGRARQVAMTIMDEHRASENLRFHGADKQLHPTPGALQIVFCDRAIPKKDGSFSIYDEIKSELIDLGMDADRIAFVHDAANGAARDELFEKCRNGQINVLIGSTSKMGTGTNIQRRAIALHHVDLPWRPADIEQREGRIIRQGNENSQVEIYQYATDKTFDIYMNDVIAKKATFIKQLKVGQQLDRSLEDPFGGLEMSAARAAAALSGDPRLEQLANLEMEVTRLRQLESAYQSQKATARARLAGSTNQLSKSRETIADLQQRIPHSIGTEGNLFRFISPDGTVIDDRVEASGMIRDRMNEALAAIASNGTHKLGTLAGHSFVFKADPSFGNVDYQLEGSPLVRTLRRDDLGKEGSYGLVQRLENFVHSLPAEVEHLQERGVELDAEIQALSDVIEEKFEHAEELATRIEELNALKDEMGDDKERSADPNELSREEMELLYVHLPKGALNQVARENDRIVFKNREHTVRLLGPNLCGFKKDDEPSNENISVKQYEQVTVVGRERSSLTEHEQKVLSYDPERDVIAYERAGLQDGDKVSVDVRTSQGTVSQMGTVKTVYGGFDFYPEGATDPQPFLTVGPILRVGATNPELIAQQEAAAEAERNRVRVGDLQPGDVVLTEIPSLGAQVGDVIRLRPSYGSSEKVAVSPDTGEVRPMPRNVWSVRNNDPENIERIVGRDLTAAEFAQVSKSSILPVSRIREGDAIPMNQIDPGMTNPEPVRISQVFGRGSERLEVTYVDVQGLKHDVKRKSDQAVEVVGRKHGALTTSEIAFLAVADRGGVLKVASELDGSDVGSYVTGSSPRGGGNFHGILHQVVPSDGVLVLMNEEFATSRHLVAGNSLVSVSDHSIPLEQLDWNQTSQLTSEPAGHRAEPERRAIDVDTSNPPAHTSAGAVVQPAELVTRTPAQPIKRNEIEHHPPMPAQVPNSSGPGIGL